MSDDLDFRMKMARASIGGNFSELEQMARELISSDPNNASAYYGLGQALAGQGELEDAITNFRISLSLDPKHAFTYTSMGLALAEQGNLDEAVTSHRMAIRLKPDFVYAYNNLGLALAEQGNLDEAIDNYRTAIRVDQYPPSYYNLGLILANQGKIAEAVENYCLGAGANYNDIDFDVLRWLMVGQASVDESKGRLSEAAQIFRCIISIYPEDFKAYYGLGVMLSRQGKLREAITNFHACLKLNPTYDLAHKSLREVNQILGETGVSQSVNDLLKQGYEASFADDFLRAEQIARKVIELDSQNVGAYTLMGLVLGKQGKLDEAIANFLVAIEIKPRAYIYMQLGIAWSMRGNQEEAITCLRTAILLEPKMTGISDCYYALGISLSIQGNLVEAIENFYNVIRIDPNNVDAQKHLREAEQQLRGGYEIAYGESSNVATSTSNKSSDSCIPHSAHKRSLKYLQRDNQGFSSFRRN